MGDADVMPGFGDVAAEDPQVSLEHEYDAVERVEEAAEAIGVHDDSELLPDEVPPAAPDDFRDATARTVGDAPQPD